MKEYSGIGSASCSVPYSIRMMSLDQEEIKQDGFRILKCEVQEDNLGDTRDESITNERKNSLQIDLSKRLPTMSDEALFKEINDETIKSQAKQLESIDEVHF